MKILISDNISQRGIEILREVESFEVHIKTNLKKEELVSIIGDYDALIVRSQTKVTKEVLNAAKNLKIIGRAGEGVDNIDMQTATEKGIIVMNTPGGNTISAAEHTLSLILSLARNIPSACNSLKNKKWEREKFKGVELYEKILGIIGFGKIGQEVAKRCLSFGMKIIIYDPFISEEKAKKLGGELVEFEYLIRNSDFITIHTPLSSETKYLIGEAEFEKMKKETRIINCARGGIIDENALYKALKDNKIHSAAIDVFETEPLVSSPLQELENVILTPHLGATTVEAQEKVGIEIAKQIKDALLYNNIRNAVNIPSIDPKIYEYLKPYILLLEKTGSFISQIIVGRIQKIKVEFSGEILEYDISPLSVALLKGVLDGLKTDVNVNYVNAMVIAKSRGIEMTEVKISIAEDYTSLISIVVTTDKEQRKISATLLEKKKPRIVKIDDFPIDAIPEGYLLVCQGVDVPGLIGKVGTILGNDNINIASLQYGRKEMGAEALLVLNIDNKVEKETIDKLLKEKEIKDTKLVIL